MIWLLNNWKIIGSALLAVGIFASGWVSGSGSVHRELDREKLAQAQAHAKALVENQKTINKLEEQKNENLAKVKSLSRELRAFRLSIPTCQALSATTGATQAAGTGGISATVQESFDRFTEGVASDFEDADRVVEDCRVLSEWARKLE